MRLKKIIVDIAVITLALLLFIIWHQNFIENSTQAASTNIKRYKVYLITANKGYQYWGIMNQGASDMATSLGVQYIWDAPAVRSVDQQIKIINKAVSDGADALLVAADDPKEISTAIEDAKARSVKVIYVDSPAYEEAITTLTTDNYKAGVQAGETMISILKSKGIMSGSIGIVNLASKANTKLREDGFRKTLEQDGRFRLLETIYTENDNLSVTQKAAESIINENEDLVALFGASEGTSLGVGNAIKVNNNKYIGVGFDNTPDMMQLLEAGSLKAILAQNQYTMGYLGVAEAVAAILGKNTGPENIDTGISVISNY